MPRRRRGRRRSVGRLLVRSLALAALVIALWASWAMRQVVRDALVARAGRDLADQANSLRAVIESDWDLTDEVEQQRLTERLRFSGIDRVAVFTGEGNNLSCVISTDDALLGETLLHLSMRLRPDTQTGLLPASAIVVIPDATGEIQEDPDEHAISVALRSDAGFILYATAGIEDLERASFGAMLKSAEAIAVILLVVGTLLMALLLLRIAMPLRRVAEMAEAVAAHRAPPRFDLQGPEEIAHLGSALAAMANEIESQRNRADTQSERWRTLFDQIPAPAFVFASSGRVLEANRQAMTLTGIERDDLERSHRDELTHGEHSLRLRSGEIMPVEWIETPLDHAGRPATLGVALNATALRTAQDQTTHLAQVLDSLDLAVIELDANGHIQASNAEAARWVGKSVEGLAGQRFEEAFESDPPVPAWDMIAEALGSHAAWEMELALPRMRGRARHCRMRIGKLRGATGHLVIVHDITETDRLAEDLAGMTRLGPLMWGTTQALRPSLRQASAAAAHLRSMCGGNSELLDGLGIIEVTSKRCLVLLRAALAFARDAALDIDDIDLNRLIQRVAASPTMMEAGGVGIELDLDPSLPHVPADAQAIERAILAVLQNAVEAAGDGSHIEIVTEHIPEGVTNVAALPPGPGPWVRITIRDTGEGMDLETLRRVAEPRFTTRGGQAGMGLTEALGAIGLHGGDLSIESEEGVGTTVAITLPLDWEALEAWWGEVAEEPAAFHHPDSPENVLIDRDETDDVVAELIAEPPAEDVDNLQEFDPETEMDTEEDLESDEVLAQDPRVEEAEESDMTTQHVDLLVREESNASKKQTERPAVLLVDDEQIVLDLVCDIFEDEEFDVLTAHGGQEALALVMSEDGARIVLAIVDLTMPDLDGWQVAEALAREKPDLCIHISSGYDTREDDIPESAQDAVAGLIHKPFRAGVLLDLIEERVSRGG